MARLPRYFAPDVPQHIILRGNNRQAIVANDEDCQFFRNTLAYAAERHGLAIHAWVLMTNHLHLLATPSDATSAPKTLQRLGRLYVHYFNRRYRRTGTLWEGRYRATAVAAEDYLIQVMRYIELNPVRAGMVASAAEYRWSSHAANATGMSDQMVTPHSVYLAIDRDCAARQAAYLDLFTLAHSQRQLDAIRESVNKGWALGGRQFQAQLEALGARRSVPLKPGRPRVNSAPVRYRSVVLI